MIRERKKNNFITMTKNKKYIDQEHQQSSDGYASDKNNKRHKPDTYEFMKYQVIKWDQTEEVVPVADKKDGKTLKNVQKSSIEKYLPENYELVRVIKKEEVSASGDLWLLKDRENTNYMAKKLKKNSDEYIITKTMEHKNIIKIIASLKNNLYVIMPYYRNETLFELVTKDENQFKLLIERNKILIQLVEVIGYLHMKNISHRDIKLENFLLSDNYDIIMIDFGLSKKCEDDEILDDICGSSLYMAPEMFSWPCIKYNGKSVDIWALGMVMFTLINCTYPFTDSDYEKLYGNKFQEINIMELRTIFDMDDMEYEFFSSIFVSSTKRLKIQGIKNSNFFKAIESSVIHVMT